MILSLLIVVVLLLLDGFGNKTRIDYGTGIQHSQFHLNDVYVVG